MHIETRGRKKELSDRQLSELKDSLRWLLKEAGWDFKALNLALGYPSESGMLKNLVYSRTTKVSTTRSRFDAVKKIREESLPPGTILIEAQTSRKNRAKTPSRTRPAVKPSRLRRTNGEVDLKIARNGVNGAVPRAEIGSSTVEFQTADAEFHAALQPDGSWLVTISSTCSTPQMIAWAHHVMNERAGSR